MSESTTPREMLEQLTPGAEIKVKLDDGSTVEGTFKGIGADDRVQVEGSDATPVDRVQLVSMEIGSSGPE